MNCWVCNCNDTVIRECEKEFIVKGKVIKETVKLRFCAMCDKQIYDEVFDEEAAKKVLLTYSKNMELIQNKSKVLEKNIIYHKIYLQKS